MIKKDKVVEDTMEDVVKLCRKLVGLECSTGNELAIGNFVYDYLKKIGVTVEKQKVAKNRYNIIGKIPGERPKIQVVTHLDTVPGKVPIKIVNGKMYGRGACDVRGQMAAILASLENCKRDLTLVFDVGEEVDFIGSEYALNLKKLQQADLCLVTEPTNCKIATTQKGIISFKVEVTGKSVTTALAHKGINAISKTIELAKRLQKHELVNLVKISGGEADNIVPDRCDLTVDVRVPAKADTNVLIRQFKRIVGKSGAFKLRVFKEPWKANITKDVLWFKKLGKLQYMDFPAYTTAQYWSRYMPTVIFGPGDYTCAHSKHEFITIKELLKGKKIYEKLWRV